MDSTVLILVAFILGFVATRIGLPPLVGYHVAGFVKDVCERLNFCQVE